MNVRSTDSSKYSASGSEKPVLSLSLDLDNKWSYLKTHGSEAWKSYPSYFDIVVPRILDFMSARDIKLTFFIVGQDASLEKNAEALAAIGSAGHEIANHSFQHEPWLHLYTKDQLNTELQRAEDAIEAATGVSVKGFRGPGFSLSSRTLEVLHSRQYRYDATAFPNLLNPLARAYFFAKSNLTAEQKEQRKALFGSYSDAFRPVKPYKWTLDSGELLELPVTTMPLFKTPVHFSYLIYLAGFSKLAAYAYLRMMIIMCKLTGTAPSLLLHPLDFMGVEDDDDLRFFPAMNMPLAKKLQLMHGFFDVLQQKFSIMTIEQYLDTLDENQPLRRYSPEFAHDIET